MKVFRLLLLVVVSLMVGIGIVFYVHPLWVADQQLHLKMWHEGFRSHYVDLPSGHIHYYEMGSGQPLLLIHGLGGRSEDWEPMTPGLVANGFHVYALDLLGYGRSAKPDTHYTIALEEKVTLEFMDAMHLQRPDVGGWSMGGWIATQLTLDHPERVNKLVIYDSAGLRYVPDFTNDFFTPSTAEGVRMLQAKIFMNTRNIPDFVMRDILRKIAQNKRIVGGSLADMMTGRELLDDRLAQMQRPMLIVWGEQDRLIPLKSVGEVFHQKVAGSQMDVVPDCGHMAPSECWQPVLADTLAFLKQP